MKTPANIPGGGVVFSVRADLAAITYQVKLEKLDSDLILRDQWNDLSSLVRCEKAPEREGQNGRAIRGCSGVQERKKGITCW